MGGSVLTPCPRAGGCSVAVRGTSRRRLHPPSALLQHLRPEQGTPSCISGSGLLMPLALRLGLARPAPGGGRGCAALAATAAIWARRRSGCQLCLHCQLTSQSSAMVSAVAAGEDARGRGLRQQCWSRVPGGGGGIWSEADPRLAKIEFCSRHGRTWHTATWLESWPSAGAQACVCSLH